MLSHKNRYDRPSEVTDLSEPDKSILSTASKVFDKLRPVLVAIAVIAGATEVLRKILTDPDQAKLAIPILATIVGGFAVAAIAYILFRFIIGLQQESRTYAQNISRRDNVDLSLRLGPLRLSSTRRSPRAVSRKGGDKSGDRSPNGLSDEPPPIDASNPNALFKLARQRLLDEAVRIDAISRRNLGIGILFSSIALGVLSWPLVAGVFFPSPEPTTPVDASTLGLFRSYLPRFSVGLLLQFVGFFFLRLYVAMN